ncbi:helix-turn-helix transcriptional regulator [Rhodococcus sp. BP-149]|uniref:helix-turn-helix domain-containing protein n=1 Tax=unclassified Rhodococcus (in: high G+C Gram-positive bacteria) TaxID=192944 RepID=UPI001C9B0CA8|nr:helix-turn-helix transcriptional regulator [Rhodococcus sp. BP-288]MBY6693730.1 helix-turn-helix transcriptional regulator [Rhodococcus sp. BP-188]MBY6699673.1 helix-turn-helix transcriptional regulator [Rhodococcus sp. BP-285]MBY6703982.1 helix-turn-helix transcriptional regulator [Rhodococcus sp. BP-283]MBY6710869.1 helix-turn-helix transcriptional regulator [Rhodococcus sp. BP-160]MBY6715895.1 helix-turn-helix transcriptional regulator [Rhodococcus sp. BP-110]MBY6720407.1 helix-turn-hel
MRPGTPALLSFRHGGIVQGRGESVDRFRVALKAPVGAVVRKKTILRAFAADTGLTYGCWRTRARMIVAADLLERGHTSPTRQQPGYSTSSGFIAAFAHEFGVTPSRYARARNEVRS